MNEVSVVIDSYEKYALELAQVIYQKKMVSKKIYDRYRKKSKWDGMSIFEKYTGGVFIDDCEWLMSNSIYKEAFAKKRNGHYKFACPLDDAVLLRGADLYYFIAAYKRKNRNLDRKQLLTWLENIKEFIKNVETIAQSRNGIMHIEKCLDEAKFVIGILDNYRHILLHCYNALILQNRADYMMPLVEIEGTHFLNILIDDVHNMMEMLIFKEDAQVEDRNIVDLSNRTLKVVVEIFTKKINECPIEDYNFYFKIHREADCFIDNYIMTEYAANIIKEENNNEKKVINFYAIMSGALELGLLLRKNLDNSNLYVVGIYGDYLKRHGYYDKKTNNKCKSEEWNCLIDDNVLTGLTIKKAMDIVSDNKIGKGKIDKCILLRYPNINRIAQMLSYGNAVSTVFLREDCIGMLEGSPYTRIALNSNIRGEYLDSFGVFTLSGEFFLRYLYKNGLFDIDSEVAYYKKHLSDEERGEYGFLL